MLGYVEPWEEDLIRLSYPIFKAKEIGAQLKRTAGNIRQIARSKLKIAKLYVELGDKFDKLEVKSLSRTDKKRGNIWLCKCICGKESFCETNTLLSGHSTSCGCGRIEAISKRTGEINGTWFSNIAKNARKRNIEFSITKEQLSELFEKQQRKCAYTGLDIKINFGKGARESTASLDRIDSSKGYTLDNIQFVHVDINFMKTVYSDEYFIHMCHLVSNNREDNYSGDGNRKFIKGKRFGC